MDLPQSTGSRVEANLRSVEFGYVISNRNFSGRENATRICGPREEYFHLTRKQVVMNVCSRPVSVGGVAWIVLALAGTTISVEAQSQPANGDQSWTATSETTTAYANPSRTKESYTKSGNRTVEMEAVEVLGPDGQYQPWIKTETETIEESPTVTRSITRTYNPNANGGEALTAVTESRTQNSPDGTARTVETTSKPDSDGNLEVVARQITATAKGDASQNSQTTFYLIDINGGLAPAMQVNEQEQQNAGGETYGKRKTTLLQDGNGNWQVYESQEVAVNADAENRTSEVHTSRLDFEGNVTPVSHVVTHQTNGDGRAVTTSVTYSVDVPGWVRDPSFRLLERSTSVRTVVPGKTVTEQRIEQPDPGDPQAGFGTTVEKTDTVVTGSSGTTQTIMITARYPDGSPSVVTVETRNSSKR